MRPEFTSKNRFGGSEKLCDEEYHNISKKRFLERVYKQKGCWIWSGYIAKHGYGVKCINPQHLFLGTTQDNIKDCFNKKRKSHQGERHPGAKIKEKDILEIFQLRKIGWTHQKIADKFGMKQASISNVLHRRLWKHVNIGEI
jgi:hypothetical protein